MYLWWIGIVLIIIFILTVVGAILSILMLRLYKTNYMLVYQVDKVATAQNKRLITTLYNADKHHDIWSTNEADLKVWVKGNIIEDVKFEKHPVLQNAIKITYPESYGTVSKFSRKGDVKITADNGKTLTDVIMLSDKIIIKRKARPKDEDSEAAILRRSLFLDYQNSDKQFRFDYANLIDFKKGTHVHVNEGKSTSTTLRYQMIIPDEYMAKISEWRPEEVKMYHTFDGYLYEMELKFIHKVGDVYEWDIINLQPNTAYVGLSLSSFHNPLIRPSKAFYGITKDEDGEISNLDGAQIAPPTKNFKRHEMWNEQIAIEAMGQELAELQYRIIAKKHFEYYEENLFLSIAEADKVFDRFVWLKTGRKDDENKN